MYISKEFVAAAEGMTTKQAITVGALAIAAFAGIVASYSYMGGALRAERLLADSGLHDIKDQGDVPRATCDFPEVGAKGIFYLNRQLSAKTKTGESVAAIICAKNAEVHIALTALPDENRQSIQP